MPANNTMKKIITIMTLAVVGLASSAMAGEVAYIAGMTGVT